MRNQHAWSRQWRASSQPRKQRLHSAHAPLHARGATLASHLSKELRAKHKRRSIRVRTGDKVVVLRGSYHGKSGRVERVDAKRTKVYITGIEVARRDGTKALVPFHPSKLAVQELASDRRRL